MPLFRPTTHAYELDTKLSPLNASNCVGCPEAWFRSGFGEEENQGVYVRVNTGEIVWAPITAMEAYETFAPEDVFECGRDGYYLTLAQARDAINRDGVHGVMYVDDYNDEYQDVFISDPRDATGQGVTNIPYAESHRAEPIR